MASNAETRPRESSLHFMVRAFRSRNYRLYFMGQGISLIGTWMQTIALGWLVYRLTRSPFLLGVVGFSSQIPMMVLMPITGVLADRWNRYRVMIINQVLATVQALILAILVLGHWLRIWHIVVLGIMLGVVNALDSPTRHAFVVQLVDRREDLPNAIALNSAMFNSARLIGPAIAGVLIAAVGEGICFLLNAISFLAVIAALLAMRISHRPRPRSGPNGIGHEFREGFRYTFGQRPLRLFILHYAWVALLGMSFTVLMPVLAKEILQGGPRSLGSLVGALGTGAIIGAFLLAARRRIHDIWKLCALSSAVFGSGLILLSASRQLWLSLLLMVLIGLGMTSQMTTSNTFLQTSVDDDKRARVMAFYLLAFFGTMPLGNLLMGTLAQVLGTTRTIFLAGCASLLGSGVFALSFRALEKKRARVPLSQS